MVVSQIENALHHYPIGPALSDETTKPAAWIPNLSAARRARTDSPEVRELFILFPRCFRGGIPGPGRCR
jgi:hypothetical protein